jgi:hypothetical protein
MPFTKNDRSLLGVTYSFSTWRDPGFPGDPQGLAYAIAISTTGKEGEQRFAFTAS